MQINAELIRKFRENQCSLAEQNAVMEYLNNHPEELEIFFDAGEWEDIQPVEKLPRALSLEMMNNIKRELFPQKKRIVIQRRILRWSAAAILIATVATVLFLQQQRDIQTVAEKQINTKTNVTATGDSSWTERYNVTDKAIAIVLPDSSKVSLQPHASLRYNKQFNVVVRDVYLSGEALFKVAKNKAKSFTVKTSWVNTTALGTAFTVTTKEDGVAVHLLEGKVVVRPAIKLRGWKNDVYLSPGEQLNYNHATDAIKIARPTGSKKSETLTVSPLRQDYRFDNTPLKEVMKKLSLSYECKINYKEQDIRNMNFTGTISKNDSLPVILNLIANMNNLLIEQRGNDYIIYKP